MRNLVQRYTAWRHSRQQSAKEREQATEIERLKSELASVKDQLDASERRHIVRDLERDELVAVIARNHQRVLRETKDLGGYVVKADAGGMSAE